jgi:hypothetical protein
MEKSKKQVSGLNAKNRGALSRRDFMARAGLVGAGVVIGPTLLAACTDRPKGIGIFAPVSIASARKTSRRTSRSSIC